MAKLLHTGKGKYGFKEYEKDTGNTIVNWYETPEQRDSVYERMRSVPEVTLKGKVNK